MAFSENAGRLTAGELEYAAGLIVRALEGTGGKSAPAAGTETVRAVPRDGESVPPEDFEALERAFELVTGVRPHRAARGDGGVSRPAAPTGEDAGEAGGAPEPRPEEDGATVPDWERDEPPEGAAGQAEVSEDAGPMGRESSEDEPAGEIQTYFRAAYDAAAKGEPPFVRLRRAEDGKIAAVFGEKEAAAGGQAGSVNRAFALGGTEAAVGKGFEMDRVSEFFRKDSRRYDTGFERY